MDPVELSKKLISYKSITPESKGSLEYIQSILEKKNLIVIYLNLVKKKLKTYMHFIMVEKDLQFALQAM